MQGKGEVWVPYVGGFSNTGGQADPQKELFGGTNFTYDWGNFLEIYVKAPPTRWNLGDSVVICACSRVWGRAGPIWAIRGVGGLGGAVPGVFGPPPRETGHLERIWVGSNHANDGQHRAV
jgi:hypothetical protein